MNRQWLYAKQPQGRIAADTFQWTETAIPVPRDGEALVRTRMLSLDPANRAWMMGKTYRDALEPGQVLDLVRQRRAGFGALGNGFIELPQGNHPQLGGLAQIARNRRQCLLPRLAQLRALCQIDVGKHAINVHQHATHGLLNDLSVHRVGRDEKRRNNGHRDCCFRSCQSCPSC